MCEFLVREARKEGLMGKFRSSKTLDILHEYFYWPHMKEMCKKYMIDPLHVSNLSLDLCLKVYTQVYMYLRNISKDFILGLPR